MKKLKHFMPTLREKKRYLVFEAISRQNYKDIAKKLTDAFISFTGTLGQAGAGMQIVMYDENTKKGIARINNKYLDHLRASLALMDINDTIVKSTYTSGMINKAKKKVK